MDLLDFVIFREVARLESISNAASSLGYVQSTVTSRIKKLEETFNTQLFYRQSRGVKLTYNGEKLLTYTNHILKLMENAKSSILDSQEIQGRLSLGAMEIAAIVRLPDILKTYLASYPNVNLKLYTDMTAELTRDVLDYKIDAAFVNAPVKHEDLEYIEAFHEQLVLVSSPNTPNSFEFNSRKSLSLLAFKRGCSYRAKMEQFFFKDGVLIDDISEFSSLEAIIANTKAGLGYSLLPISVVQKYLDNNELKVIPIDNDDFFTTTVLVWRKDISISPPLQKLIELIDTTKLQ